MSRHRFSELMEAPEAALAALEGEFQRHSHGREAGEGRGANVRDVYVAQIDRQILDDRIQHRLDEIASLRLEQARLVLKEMAEVDAGAREDLAFKNAHILEAIVMACYRPAVPFSTRDEESGPDVRGRLSADGDEWQKVLRRALPRQNEAGRSIMANARACGRVEDPTGAHLGSGFRVTPDLFATNRHVAVALYRQRDLRWVPVVPGGGQVGFDRVAGADRPHAIAFEDVVHIDPSLSGPDIALIRLRDAGDHHLKLRDSRLDPRSLEGRIVYAIGHPRVDRGAAVSGVFDCAHSGLKHLMPGCVHWSGQEKEIRHDCSTMGGASGSPLIDAGATNKPGDVDPDDIGVVLAVHFSGAYDVTQVFGPANYAVPSWWVLEALPGALAKEIADAG